MSTDRIINSEVLNDEVDQSKDWSSEMKKSDIWTSSAQNRLALQLKVETEESGKNIREVQRGDTLGAIAKALNGNLNWSQKVDYRSSKLDSNRKPKVLSKASLIYPGQYVWIEDGTIVVADERPVSAKPLEPDPINIPRVEPAPNSEDEEHDCPKKTPPDCPNHDESPVERQEEVPPANQVEEVPPSEQREEVPPKNPSKEESPGDEQPPILDFPVEDERDPNKIPEFIPDITNPEVTPRKPGTDELPGDEQPPILDFPVENERDPNKTPEFIPDITNPEVAPKPLKPIARDMVIRLRLDAIDRLPTLGLNEAAKSRILNLLEGTGIHPEVNFSPERWPSNRNDFVRQVIEEAGDGFFTLYHLDETELVRGLRRPKISGNLEVNSPEVLAEVAAPKSRIMGFEYVELSSSGELLVTSVYDYGPAEKAGLKAGDTVVTVNGVTPSFLLSQSGFVASQSEIALTVKRHDRSGLIEIKVIPEQLDRLREADTEEVDADILWVKAPFGFSKSLTEDFEEKLRESGRRSIIIDLRGNPGGLTNEAAQLAEKLESLHGQGFRIALLTNARTASASEILAAEAQEGGWAKVIGEKTYGKHVQQVSQIAGSYVVTYTTGFHPAGKKVPVTPDIQVRGAEAFEVALRELRPTS